MEEALNLKSIGEFHWSVDSTNASVADTPRTHTHLGVYAVCVYPGVSKESEKSKEDGPF